MSNGAAQKRKNKNNKINFSRCMSSRHDARLFLARLSRVPRGRVVREREREMGERGVGERERWEKEAGR